MDTSNQEEADTRLAYHVSHALNTGDPEILIVTGDTDVVVIISGQVRDLHCPEKVWISFGRGLNKKLFDLGYIRKNIGSDKCHALPFLLSHWL